MDQREKIPRSGRRGIVFLTTIFESKADSNLKKIFSVHGNTMLAQF